jgi:monothiol glutaredoxin
VEKEKINIIERTRVMSDPVQEHIEKQVKSDKVVLFMKGIPEAPQCGFSAKVVEMLNSYDVSFKTVDVLADSAVRQGIKIYSNWPTIPQLYVKGEFVGGCDIVSDLHQRGELKQLLES